ncbi:AAA family ATPase [Sulfitobacter sp. S0837]|uniref:AAA family ATPase n=1 Tax=Sulfitobacter maritimus TaxID=2741719 RepID=UPI001582489C|nr:AAA family ATPase [Sulfitobacter maritimus]
MLQRFEIESFRKLESVSLEELAEFNLIVGRNNSGKTSILEAVAVGLAMGEAREILSVARKRDSRSNVVLAGPSYLSDIVSWMFPAPSTSFWDVNFDGSIKLKYTADDCELKVEMSCRRAFFDPSEEPRSRLDSANKFEPLRGIEVATVVQERTPSSVDFLEIANMEFSLGARSVDRESITTRHQIKQRIPFEYISPYSHRNSNSSESFVRRLQDENEKHEIVELLRGIDEDIVDFFYEPFLGNHRSRGGRAVIKTRAGKYIPLSVLGDGVRRVFELGAALHYSRNGVLLVDEIEAGFHVGMLGDVYRWLTSKASQNDVQIIASSHSLEAIQAMVEAAAISSKSETLRGFSIGLDRKFGKVRHYFGKELYSLISDNGLDIR